MPVLDVMIMGLHGNQTTSRLMMTSRSTGAAKSQSKASRAMHFVWLRVAGSPATNAR